MRNEPLLLILLLAACESRTGSTATTSGGEVETEPEECTATLRIESLDGVENGKRLAVATDEPVEIPRMRVTAVRHCERSGSSELAVGDEAGVCTRGPTGGAVVAHVSCWWAGVTSEIQLLRVEDNLVVRRAALDEHGRSGSVTELGAIGLPEGAHLVPLDEAGH